MSDIDARVYGYEPAQSQLRGLRARIAELERGRFDHERKMVEVEVVNDGEWPLERGRLLRKIAELEAALSKSIMHQKELDRCVHLTEEQIDKLWTMTNDHSERETVRSALAVIGIVACEKCGGSRTTQGILGFLNACPACHRNGKSHGWVWAP